MLMLSSVVGVQELDPSYMYRSQFPKSFELHHSCQHPEATLIGPGMDGIQPSNNSGLPKLSFPFLGCLLFHTYTYHLNLEKYNGMLVLSSI
nr:hypothetical protein Iba_chr07cCG1960 [Ipomoea batatas]